MDASTIAIAVLGVALAVSVVLNVFQASAAPRVEAFPVVPPRPEPSDTKPQPSQKFDQAVRLPRVDVRDPLPGSSSIVAVKTAEATPAAKSSRLSPAGRLRMQANHPNYSPAKRREAREQLKAMGEPVKHSRKRKTT